MIDFTKPDVNYWFKPEFARPKEIPDNFKIKYFLINGKRKRFKVWREFGCTFRENKGEVWRTIKTDAESINEIMKDVLASSIKNMFERDDKFYDLLRNKR